MTISNRELREDIIHNMNTDRLIVCIVDIIREEFNKKIFLLIDRNFYAFHIDGSKTVIKKGTALYYQMKDAYALDRYILSELIENGIELVKDNCLYLKHCYGL